MEKFVNGLEKLPEPPKEKNFAGIFDYMCKLCNRQVLYIICAKKYSYCYKHATIMFMSALAKLSIFELWVIS